MSPATVRTASIGERCRLWWAEYCAPNDGDPATRARLRRCRSTAEALTIAPAIGLARRLGGVVERRDALDTRFERSLTLARLLAHVSVDDSMSVMRVVGYQHFPGDRDAPDDGNRPLLSETRFKRLLLNPAGEELLTALIRLLAQVDGRANIARLAQDVWWWNDRTRERWAFEYFAAGVAVPTLQNSEEETTE
ncbi:MAG: type I-E CRISPR-associated protein Cse2/CasB [Gemmatimonadaceae bacterium]